MNKVLVTTTKQISGLSDEAYFLEYYLVEEEVIPEGGIGICDYGVEVIKRTGEATESKLVSQINCDRLLVLDLIDSLARNIVTPTTLLDVISDKLVNGKPPHVSRRLSSSLDKNIRPPGLCRAFFLYVVCGICALSIYR